MKKLYLSFIISIFIQVAVFGQEAYITQSLHKKLSTETSEFIRVDIIMTQQLDCYAFKLQLDQHKVDAKDRPLMVMNELKKISEQSCEAVEMVLAANPGEWRNLKRHWLVNMMVVDVRPEFIQTLKKTSGIEIIELDEANTAKPIEPVEVQLEAAQSPGGIEQGLRVINAPALWAMGYTGRNRIAFTLDTGVWPNHPAFRDQFIGNHFSMQQGWFGFDYPLPADKGNSHGTHVTGTMLGLDPANNDTIGAAFNAYFMVSDPVATSMATVKPITAFIDAFEWTFNPDGDTATTSDIPDVINNSWGYDVAKDTLLCVSFVSQMFDALEAAGIPAVFSAGNEGPGDSTISTPHHINTGLVNSFTVGSINPHDTAFPISSFSSRGPSVCPASGALAIKPEVVAPGQQIRSAVSTNSYAVYDGTSMASPHVSGAVLLLREAFPTLTGEEILLALYYSAHDLGAVGEDNTFGRGIIDVLAAFNYLAQSHTPVAPRLNTYDLSVGAVIHPNTSFICDSVYTPVIEVRNSGDSTINGYIVEYMADSSQYLFTQNNPILPGTTQQISLPAIHLKTGSQEVIFKVKPLATLTESDDFNNNRSARFYVSKNAQLPYFEDFEFDDLAKGGWNSENPDVVRGWTIDTTGGHFGYRSAKMECYGYSPKASQTDDLISPRILTPASGNLTLIFDYAYQLRLPQIADTLRILVMNCANPQSKIKIWQKGGQDLETFDTSATYFIPKLANHWGTDTISLNQFINTGEILIDFQSINRMGNNIYIDNVRVYEGNTPPNSIFEAPAPKVNIYPNPAHDNVVIDYQHFTSGFQISVWDIYGRKMMDDHIQKSENGRHQLDLSNYTSGVYIIRITNSGWNKSFKIVKE